MFIYLLGLIPSNYVQHFDDEMPPQSESKRKKIKLSVKSVSPFILSLQKDCGFRTIDGKVKYNGVEVDEKLELEKEKKELEKIEKEKLIDNKQAQG